MAEGVQSAIHLEIPDVNIENDNLLKSLTITTPIHAGVLYIEEGKELNQTLCLLLSGTRSSAHYSNWEDFAFSVGLSPHIIQCIKHNLIQQDPTTYVLLAYVQEDDPTIQKILKALVEIKRYDILKQIEPLIRNINKELTSIHQTKILKTLKTLKSPFVLRNLKNQDHRQELELPSLTLAIMESLMENNEIIQNVQKCMAFETFPIEKTAFNRYEVEHLQKSTMVVPTMTIKEKPYDVTIFLTYTSDASEIVENLLKTLRTPRDGFRIGVLVLNEHFFKVSQSPEQFIFECFAQVDYVFPIITNNYLLEVTEKSKNPISSPILNYDHQYVKYIFNLMMTHYVRNKCKNKMVSCIIPDNIIREVLRHRLMGHPLLQVWVSLNEIDLLIKAILKQKKLR